VEKKCDLKTTLGSAYSLDVKNVKVFPIKNSLPQGKELV